MRRKLESQVDALIAAWREMCSCVPAPVAFSNMEQLTEAIVDRCPNHGVTFDPEQSSIFDSGAWRPVCAPYGFPANADGALDFDDPSCCSPSEAEQVLSGRAAYEALPEHRRPVPALFTRKEFDFVFNYGQGELAGLAFNSLTALSGRKGNSL